MSPRVPLPHPFDAEPFSMRDGLGAGLSRKRLAGRDLETPFRGVRATGDGSPEVFYTPRLRPGERFSHTTALRLWGAPLPRHHEDTLHVTSSDHGRPRIDGVLAHRSTTSLSVRRQRRPVSPAIRAFLESATLLGEDDLTAVADYLILDPRILDPLEIRPYASLAELRNAAEAFRGRGALRARAAAELVRPDGWVVGWFDLAWPQWKVIAEYDGDQHRTSRTQHEKDIRRFDDADELGWKVIRVRDHGIRSPHDTVTRVSVALAARGWTPSGQKNPSASA